MTAQFVGYVDTDRRCDGFGQERHGVFTRDSEQPRQ